MKRALSTILKLGVSAGLLYYLLVRSDLQEFAGIVSGASGLYLVTAVLFFVLSNVLGAVQWHLLLKAQQLPIRFRQSLIFYWIGVFFNNVLLGNIGGDALRIYDIRRLTGEGTGGGPPPPSWTASSACFLPAPSPSSPSWRYPKCAPQSSSWCWSPSGWPSSCCCAWD